MSRAAIATLSTENLLFNLNKIQKMAPHSQIIAMIKANAYGHGLRSVAQRLENTSIASLGVASIEEALALRKIGIKCPITLMEGVFEPDELIVASTQNFHVVFHDASQIEWLKNIRIPLPLVAWLKFNSGMGRLGFESLLADKYYEFLSNHPAIVKPIGIMSHFACADTFSHPLNLVQIKNFQNFTQNKHGPKSFANSAAIMHFEQIHYQQIRPGLLLYGVSPFADKKGHELGFKPVMTLQTRLIAKTLRPAKSFIGYGATYQCQTESPIGVIAIGYGDGYPRGTPAGTHVLVNQVPCQIIGRVSMDMMTIDLTTCPEAQVGDPVVLWGEDLPIENLALASQRSPYELLTGVTARVKFHWTLFKGNE